MNGTARVPLSRGYSTLVDVADLPLLDGGTWHALVRDRGVYGHGRTADGRRVLIHRLVLGLTRGDGVQVDHIDHDGLNNTRANLRATSPGQNNSNRRGASRASATGVLGVCPTRSGGFAAQIQVNREHIYITTTRSALTAAIARNDYIRQNGLTWHTLSDLAAAATYDEGRTVA